MPTNYVISYDAIVVENKLYYYYAVEYGVGTHEIIVGTHVVRSISNSYELVQQWDQWKTYPT